MRISLLLVVALSVLGSWENVYADYTITSPSSNTTSLASWSSTSEAAADYFESVGAGSVSTVDFCAGVDSGTPGGVVVKIWANSAGTPGSLLGTSNPITVTDPNHLHEFTFATPIDLTATTGYWISLGGPSGNVIENCGTASELGTYGTKYTTNSGSTWSGEQNWTQNYDVYVTEGGGGGDPPTGDVSTTTASTTVSVLEAGDIIFMLGWLVFFQALMVMGMVWNTVMPSKYDH